MNLTLANNTDLNGIMEIVKDAQIHLAAQQIDQWQNGYPNEAVMKQDLANKESYVVKDERATLMGIAMFTTRREPTYSAIDGAWLTAENSVYGVIHRMAVSNNFRKRGVAKFIFKTCEQKLADGKIESMRIDTHEQNTEMQALLKYLDYVYCGVILLENGDRRLAFEKIIS